MHIACKCLNVSIKSRGSELFNVNLDEIELTAEERADNFFRENLASVPELEGITKEQSSLVEVRNVGSWAIHRCYNCSMFTHAVHREHGAALVLINTNILTTEEEINSVKSSSDYSPIFRIAIDHSILYDFDNPEQPIKFSALQLPTNVQVVLNSLQQQLLEAVQCQTTIIEERIRNYTAEQYQLLEQFREQAHNEHRILRRLICNNQVINKVASNIETPPATPESFKSGLTPSVTNTTDKKVGLISSDKKTVNTVKTSQVVGSVYPETICINTPDSKDTSVVRSEEPGSIDAEALFSLEGMEDTSATDNQQLSEEESDTDDSGHDEGIHMSRGQRSGHPTLAKSLPISVPTFPSFGRHVIPAQDDDQLSRDPLDPHNIRASIKALAKSVHGDTVFGDLPRPRFSTQI